MRERAVLAAFPGIRRNLRELAALQQADEGTVEALQTAKLNRLLQHFAADAAFRERAGLAAADLCFRGTAELERLPVTTKPDLRDWAARAAESGQAHRKNSTSGSTGSNLVFYQSRSMLRARTAAVAFTYRLLGVSYWTDRKVIVWGRSPWLGRKTRLRLALNRAFLNITVLEGFDATQQSALARLAQIERLRPALLEGYPSYLAQLATVGMDAGRPRPELEARTVIVTSGEQLQPEQRTAIETFFGRPVVNRYGSREFGVIAIERPGQDGMWVPPTRYVLENGPDGELLVTDLDNYAFPFIRYNIGDLARVERTGGVQVLQRLEGRIHDVIRTPSGHVLPGQFWTLFVRSVPGIREFQVVQTDEAAVLLKVVADASFADDARNLLLTRFGDRYGSEMRLDIEQVDAIPLTGLGKRRFVIGLAERARG